MDGFFPRLNIAALPSGAFLDRFGPRVTSIVFCALVGLGCLIFAEGPEQELAYIVGFRPKIARDIFFNGSHFTWSCLPKQDLFLGFLLIGVSGPVIFNCTLSFGRPATIWSIFLFVCIG